MTDNSECAQGGAVEARESEIRHELDELRLEIEEVRASRRRLVLSADADRRGFERSLHDGLQQQLVGIAANIELAARSIESDPAEATKLLAEMRGDVRQALEQTRTLAHRIAPPLLEAGGLTVALRSAAADADVASRIDVEAGSELPEDLAGAVYFCFVDVLERARAGTSVSITVRAKEANLAFELVADGDVDTEGVSIRDRVEAFGGELEMRSEPGDRTTWAGTVPLPE